MAEEYARSVARVVVAQLCASFDIQVVQESALDALVSQDAYTSISTFS
jgi:hypothetical protein